MDLPPEIVREILSRFPLQEAGKSKILSKSYAKASYEAHYKHLNAERQAGPVLDGFLLQCLRKNRHCFSFVSPRPRPPPTSNFHDCDYPSSFSFLPGSDPEILAVSPNGLVICQTRHPGRRRRSAPIYCICKPSTKQWKGMPLPKTRYFTMATAITLLSSDPLRFKVVRFSKNYTPSKQPTPRSYLVCELFDSQTWRWTRLHDVVLPPHSRFIDSHSPSVSASGSAHCLLDDRTVLAFDFDSQSCSFIAPPAHYHRHRDNQVKLAQYEGKLAMMLMLQEGPATEMWVMERYEKRIWTRNLDLAMEMPMAFYSSDVVMSRMFLEVEFRNFVHAGGCTYSPTQWPMYDSPNIFPFLSDFEPCSFFDNAPPRRLTPRTVLKILRKNNLHLSFPFLSFCISTLATLFFFTFLRTIFIATTLTACNYDSHSDSEY